MSDFRVRAGIENTDVSVIIRIVDATTALPETGVTSATTGLDLEYRRDGADTTDITESDLSALDDAHSDGGMFEIGNGYYRLDLPDAAVAAGVRNVLVHGTATGMVVLGCKVEIIPFSEHGIIAIGTLQAGGTSSVTVAAGQVADDDAWNGFAFVPTGGTGEGFAGRVISDSTDADVITFDTSLGFTADGTTTYAIYATVPAGIQSSVEAGLTTFDVVTNPDLETLIGTPADTDVSTDIANLVALIGTPAGADLVADIVAAAAAVSVDIAALENLSAAEVNAEVVDALSVDTYAEPAQGAPAATASLALKLGLLYKAWRNKSDSDGTTLNLYNDDGSTVDHKTTTSEAGGTVTRGEMISGA